MSFFDDLGLRAAEQLEQSVGPYVALASYKRLFAGPPEIRAKAALGALRCAVALDDDAEIAGLCDTWRGAAAAGGSAAPFIAGLLQRNKGALALALATAEEQRAPSMLGAYLRLRSEEHTRARGAGVVVQGYRDLARAALAAGDARLAAHAAARYAGLAFEHARHDETASLARADLVEVAEAVRLELTSPIERLPLLRARLLSASRFHRAGALSALEELARIGDDAVRAEAVTVAARHLLALFARLDAVEIDRIGAALKQWPDAPRRAAAVAQLPAWVRVIAAFRATPSDREARLDQALGALAERSPEIARGLALARDAGADGPTSRPLGSTPEESLAWLGVEAGAALDRDDPAHAERTFERARGMLGPDVAVPPSLWSAAHRALLHARDPARRAAADLVDRALARTTSVPHRPLVDIALALSRAGHSLASGRALAEAARWKEAGAEALFADEKRRAAYDALARGDHAASLALLREARTLFVGRPV